jgi:D-sedoheptulose 7-phosphate isomerase
MNDTIHPIFNRLFERYPELEAIKNDILAAAEIVKNAALNGSKILVCGNGGSAADADHITGELLKSFRKKRPLDEKLKAGLLQLDPVAGKSLAEKLQGGVQAIALIHHAALSTAFGNDVDPSLVFAQQCHVFGREDDVLWGISTSGNAENVYKAALTAKAKGLKVIGMTGSGGGKLKPVCDVCIAVPRSETYEVQELHLPVYHALCLFIEDSLW